MKQTYAEALRNKFSNLYGLVGTGHTQADWLTNIIDQLNGDLSNDNKEDVNQRFERFIGISLYDAMVKANKIWREAKGYTADFTTEATS